MSTSYRQKIRKQEFFKGRNLKKEAEKKALEGKQEGFKLKFVGYILVVVTASMVIFI